MTALDFFSILIFLMAIFTMTIRPTVNALVYRLFRFFVVLLIVFFFIFSSTGWESVGNGLVRAFNIIAKITLLLVFMRHEARVLIHVIGEKTGLFVQKAIEDEAKNELIESVEYLTRHRIGALVTFERTDSLDEYIKHAFEVEAPLTNELLSSIFVPYTPLHDGAVIIRENTIKCAGAYFPPSDNAKVPKYLGSRHRAAIGISETTDSLTVVVSEQTGDLSVAIGGYLDKDISRESLLLYLEKYLQK